MRGEIVAVGAELLRGETLNTNARFLSQALTALGVEVRHHAVVPDDARAAADAIRRALGRAEIVVISGGLGPTPDDPTRDAVALATGRDLVEDPGARELVARHFERRGVTPPAPVWKQAMVPAGARVLPNPVGSAPGFLLEDRGTVLIALPGPPRELEAVFEEAVRPYLARLAAPQRPGAASRVLRVCGLEEAAIAARLEDLLAAPNPLVTTYARPGEVRVRIAARAADEDQAAALVAAAEEAIRSRLGSHVFGADDVTLEAAVGDALRRRGLTLALAESCTGGLVGHRITNVPGSSDYFLFGAVVYANAAKEAVLGVPGETIRRHGAVSHETAAAMAEGVRRVAGSDIGVATTGIAGPGGGTPAKPVGTVFFGLATPEGTRTERRLFTGGRGDIKEMAAQEALTLLWLHLSATGDQGRREEGEP